MRSTVAESEIAKKAVAASDRSRLDGAFQGKPATQSRAGNPRSRPRRRRLSKRVVYRGELGVELGAESVHDRDYRKRNTRGNQAVFDGGGTGLIPQEFVDHLHRALPFIFTKRSFWIKTRDSLAAVSDVIQICCVTANLEG
jgi:hypothetical protein